MRSYVVAVPSIRRAGRSGGYYELMMQSPTNGLLLTRQGMHDDISLDVAIRRGALAFATRVYVNESQLRSETAKLMLALKQAFNAIESTQIQLAFGPQITHSPSLGISIRFDRLGHVRMGVSMVAEFLDGAPPIGSDTCTINLVSDLASLDSFAAQLSSMSDYASSTAHFVAE